MGKIEDDPRIDPRIKAFAAFIPAVPQSDVTSRDELLAAVNTPEALAEAEQAKALLDVLDDETVAPSKGLDVSTVEFTSSPDGNTMKIQLIRPQSEVPLPCVYYIHGGGMQALSCFDGLYRAWGRIIAGQGVAVAMVDFRNCVMPSSAPEVAPYPAGLNDCVSGVKWVAAHADELGIDADAHRRGGRERWWQPHAGHRDEAQRRRRSWIIRGLYAMCPYIAGSWPQDRFPSSTENNGIFLDLHHNRGAMAYGIEAFEARDPLAWPSFATEDDVTASCPP